MNEYVIIVDDVTQLMQMLASNVVGEKETELLVTDGATQTIVWFTPHEASSKGFTGSQVFRGYVSTTQGVDISQMALASIQLEDRLLVLIADL